MVSNLFDYFPTLTKSAISKKGQFNNLSQSLNSAFSSTVSKIGEFKTNIIYSIKHSDVSSRKEIEILKGGPKAELLGQSYSYE